MEENKTIEQKETLDLNEIFFRIKRKRLFILKIALLFFFIGVAAVLFMRKEYCVTCTIVPQGSSAPKISGNLGGLAAMAGIDISGFSGSGELLSLSLYPQMLDNINFKRELVKTPLTLSKVSAPTTFYDYALSPKYQRFLWWKRFKARTIYYFANRQRAKARAQIKSDLKKTKELTFVSLSEAEDGATKTLLTAVKLTVSTKDNYAQIKVYMPEAVAAAQMASATQELLEKYIIQFKTRKTQEMLDFVQSRFNEAEARYNEKSQRLARYQDANRTLVSALSQNTQKRLEEELQLAFDVYASLAQQLEQTKISVQEKMPVFLVIEPVVLPIEPEGLGRGVVLLVFILLGFLVPIGILIITPSLAELFQKEELLSWLEKEDTGFFNWKRKKRTQSL